MEDPESVFEWRRVKNDWKDWGMPWTYSLDPDRVLIEEGSSTQFKGPDAP